MTSKLKCPFCQTELEQMHNKKMLGCPKCLHIADGAFWEIVIQAKQDLEIATKALILAKWWLGSSCVATAEKTIDKALEQIEHKDKK